MDVIAPVGQEPPREKKNANPENNLSWCQSGTPEWWWIFHQVCFYISMACCTTLLYAISTEYSPRPSDSASIPMEKVEHRSTAHWTFDPAWSENRTPSFNTVSRNNNNEKATFCNCFHGWDRRSGQGTQIQILWLWWLSKSELGQLPPEWKETFWTSKFWIKSRKRKIPFISWSVLEYQSGRSECILASLMTSVNKRVNYYTVTVMLEEVL